MPNRLRFDFVALLDATQQQHRFDLNVPTLVLGPLPDDTEITSRVMLATLDDLRQHKWAFTLASSREFLIGDRDPESVWNRLLARWMQAVPSSARLPEDLPEHFVKTLRRLQWDVRSRTLILGPWPTANEAWQWIAEAFDPRTFPAAAPVPVFVWESYVAYAS